MSWRSSGNFRSSGGPRSSDRSDGDGSVFSGGSAGGPPLLVLIGATVVLGVAALIIAIVAGAVSRPAQPAAAPTAAPAAAPTAAPAAAPTVAPAAAAPTAAPAAGGAAAIPTAPLGPAVASGSGAALEIGSDGDKLAFNKASLDAAAGKIFTLSFKNNASGVQHNWVLVKGGADVVDAVEAAASAQSRKARNAAAAVPAADTPGLLVALPMIDAGATGTVSFTAPAAGTYTFICTFPGHYQAGMQGQLVVK